MNCIASTAGRPVRRTFCVLLALPLLLLMTLVSTADLWHAHAHGDAGHAEHDCSVVHWKAGELGFAEAGLPLPRISLLPALELASLAQPLPVSAEHRPTSARDPPLV